MAICNQCKKEFEGNTFRCPECLRYARETAAYNKRIWIKEGSCSTCGKDREDKKYRMCQKCRDGFAEIRRKSRARKKLERV